MATAHAAGVEYSRIPGFDQDLFRCETWRATMSVPACTKRWTEAQTAKLERAEQLRLCRVCHHGASHAGKKFIERGANYMDVYGPRPIATSLAVQAQVTTADVYPAS